MSSTRTRRVTTATLAVAAGAAPLINAAAATAQDATSVQNLTPQVSAASARITDALHRALPVAGSAANLGPVQSVVGQVLPAPLSNLPVSGALQQGTGALTGNLAEGAAPLGTRSSLEAQGLAAPSLADSTPLKSLAGSASGLASQVPGVGGLASALPGGNLGNVVPDVSSLGNVTSSVPGLSSVKGLAGNLPVAGALKNTPLAGVAGSVGQF